MKLSDTIYTQRWIWYSFVHSLCDIKKPCRHMPARLKCFNYSSVSSKSKSGMLPLASPVSETS